MPKLSSGQKVAYFGEGRVELYFSAVPTNAVVVPYYGQEPIATDFMVNGHKVYTLPSDGWVTIAADEQGAWYDYGAEPWVLDRAGRAIASAAVTIAASATLTVAQLLSLKLIATTAAATTITTPTAATLDAALGQGNGVETGRAIQFSVINTGGLNAATMAANTGVTAVGNMVVAAGASGRFELMRTAAGAYTMTRLS